MGLPGVAGRLRALAWNVDAMVPAFRPSHAITLTRLWVGDRRRRGSYPVLSEPELHAMRRSDTVFVFGSGRSLTDIGDEEWERIAEHDVVGFSHFHRQRWVHVDYHLVAEVPSVRETAESIRANPFYRSTVFGLMDGWIAEASNALIAGGLLAPGTRVFRWRRIGRDRTLPPSSSLENGLVHGTNSILDVVNFALVLGWRRVVIAGVDLYNREYFWLPAGVGRPDDRAWLTVTDTWPQADQILEAFALWRRLADLGGVELLAYNPRSLLTRVLPIFSWDR
jgi:hypothetical protein